VNKKLSMMPNFSQMSVNTKVKDEESDSISGSEKSAIDEE
jgi:hypothetical protein